MSSPETISPTAHYTGYVWVRNGLSHPELATRQGRLLFESLRPVNAISRALGGASLEAYLLARHRAIDTLLARAIDEGAVTQVIEVASGLSPRGWRFTQRYAERLIYVEADLPEMAARKRRALTRMGALSERHRVQEIDALSDEGPASLAAVAASLNREGGVAIITEGLIGYLDGEARDRVWRRVALTLHHFKTGRYISDLHLGGLHTMQVRAFRAVLSAFVRGRVHLHFQDAEQASVALRAAGFDSAIVRRASELADVDGPGSRLAHIIEASTTA